MGPPICSSCGSGARQRAARSPTPDEHNAPAARPGVECTAPPAGLASAPVILARRGTASLGDADLLQARASETKAREHQRGGGAMGQGDQQALGETRARISREIVRLQ